MLFVANAQTQSVAVVSSVTGCSRPRGRRLTVTTTRGDDERYRSRVVGFIPTARYPSALAVVGAELFIGNGKGEPPPRPNAPTDAFPAKRSCAAPTRRL